MIGKRLRWATALGMILAGHGAASRSTAETPYYVPSLAAPGSAASLGRPIAASSPAAQLQRPVASAETAIALTFPLRRCHRSSTRKAARSSAARRRTGRIPRCRIISRRRLRLHRRLRPPPYGAPAEGYIPGAPYEQPLTHPNGFWDKCKGIFGGSGNGGINFKSDAAFEGLITPVSNPFFFEDPRSVTEVRPLFIVQDAPGSSRNPVFDRGDSYFYGLQGRLALTEQWSIVINKLGFVTFQPKNPQLDPNGDIQRGTGFAEFDIGPKFTFLRNTNTGTVMAFGVNLDLPVGSKKELQDTGTLSIDPYFTIGQTFGRSSWGQFNFVGTAGFDFAADDQRSDFFHSALHLDYDIACAHKWFPLAELNWFHYTSSGSDRPISFEGVDLGNFGASDVSGHNDLSLALGLRYKFSEHIQAGAAFELPLVGERDIQEYRFTFDLIFRY